MKRPHPEKSDEESLIQQQVTEEEDIEQEVALRIKWSGTLYPVELSPTSTIAELKNRLYELTEVLPKRQRVLGLPKVDGSVALDHHRMCDLRLKPEQRLMLIGSREEAISAVSAPVHVNDVINDLDIDYEDDENRRSVRNEVIWRQRLRRRIENTQIEFINEPRPGKKLLVLDLDYTLFDCKSSAASIAELGRPGLHPFLTSAYRYYDIVIWSQTSWRWLEAKLTGLSMLLSPSYKISFVLDRTSMFSITSRRGSHERSHEVKALELIWRKFPERWDASNTIHIDDLSRNFALNPQSGLKILPFKNANVTRESDRELYLLDRYLALIAEKESDFTKLKHKHWKRYCAKHDNSTNGDSSGQGPGSSSAQQQ